MICWAFAAVALAAALVASVAGSMKRASLSLWICGLSMGGIYLTLGSETLAIIQWMVSTLVAISLFFFAVMFGEYESRDRRDARPAARKIMSIAAAALLGLAFAAVVELGSGPMTPAMLAIPKRGNDLSSLGRVLTEGHLLSLEVLALTLFLVLVGGGVVARPAEDEDGGDGKGREEC